MRYSFTSPNPSRRNINAALEIEKDGAGNYTIIVYKCEAVEGKKDMNDTEVGRVVLNSPSFDGFITQLKHFRWNITKFLDDVQAKKAEIASLFPTVGEVQAPKVDAEYIAEHFTEDELLDIAERSAAKKAARQKAEAEQTTPEVVEQ